MRGFAKDRSGRVPFSIVAVVILVGSAATGAYVQQVSREAGERRGRSAGAIAEALLPGLRADLARIAGRCIDNAVDRQTDIDMDEASQGLWSVDQNFRRYFDIELRKEWGWRQFGKHCLTVEAGEASVQLATSPMTIRAINRLGMAVNMTAPAGFRITGSVNFTFTCQGQMLQKKVDLGLERPSWYPLALFQANRLRRDCENEGLLELLYKELFGAYMAREFESLLSARNRTIGASPSVKVTAGDLWKKLDEDEPAFNALDIAMTIEEQALFGASRTGILNGFMNHTGRRHLSLDSAMPAPGGAFDGWQAFVEPGNATGMTLDMAPFFRGLTVLPMDGKGAGAGRFAFEVGSWWKEAPFPVLRKVAFAGEEELVDVYMLEVAVDGLWQMRVGPDRDHQLRLDIPVHLGFAIDHRIREPDASRAESGREHCQLEDLELFDGMYAKLFSGRQNLTVQAVNSSGIRAGSLPDRAAIDIALDGDPVGSYRSRDFRGKGVVLQNVQSGPHVLALVITDAGARTAEYAAVAFSIGREDAAIDVATAVDADTTELWTYILLYLRDTPAESRLVRMLELFTGLTGYPMPDEVRGASSNSAEGTQRLLAWTLRFSDWLEHAGAVPADGRGQSSQSRRGMLEMLKLVIIVITQVERTLSLAQLKGADRALKMGSLVFKVVAGLNNASRFRSIVAKIEADGASGSVKGVKPDGAREWSVSGGGEGSEVRAGRPDSAARRAETTARVGYALDLIAIFLMVVSYYSKEKVYASDGTISGSEELNLRLDLAKVVLKTSALLAKMASAALQNSLKAASKALSVLGEFFNAIVAVAILYQSVTSESEKYRGDPVFWETLATGFDESTATFCYALVTAVIGIFTLAVAFGAAAGFLVAAPFLAVLGPVGWAVLLVYCVAMLILNWDSIIHWAGGTVDDKTKSSAIESMGSTLRGTVRTVASLNEFRSDHLMASARESRGTGFLLAGLASFSAGESLSTEFRNLSLRSYDKAYAMECQAEASSSLRYFLVGLWMQADDFIDDDDRRSQASREESDRHGFTDTNWVGTDFHFDGDIIVKGRGELAQGNISRALLELNRTTAPGFDVGFRLNEKDGIPEEALREWMATVARIGDQVSVWQERFLAAQAKAAYVGGLDGPTYRNDLGHLRIGMSPAYSSAGVRVTLKDGGRVCYLDGSSLRSVERLELELTCSTVPLAVYVCPGKYTVEVVSTVPPMEPAWPRTTLEAFPLHFVAFSSNMAAVEPRASPVYFTIDDSFNGTANVSVECYDFSGNLKGTLFSGRNFTNASDRSCEYFIDSQWIPGFNADGLGWKVFQSDEVVERAKESLKFEIRITIALDRDSDGTVDCWANRTVGTKAIRDDHVARMKSDEKKADRQLHYRLEIYNDLTKTGERRRSDGTPVDVLGLSDWKLVN